MLWPSYPVDPAGGHTLVPRTKPCICAAHFNRQTGFGLSREGLCGRLIIAIAIPSEGCLNDILRIYVVTHR